MTTFIVQFGNNNGVFWKEVKADTLTSAKIKATAIANRHTEDVIMLAIETPEGELLASKNFAGKKAVWESHVEEVKEVTTIIKAEDVVSDTQEGFVSRCQFNSEPQGFVSRCVFAEITPPAPISLVVQYHQETGEETCHVWQDGIKFEIFGLIVPPLHHRIQLGKFVDEIYYTVSKAAYKALCAFEHEQAPMNQLCFIELENGIDVYVTTDEASSLGVTQAYSRDINKDMRALLPPSKGIAQLMYAGISFNERCEPYLFGQDQAVVELCVNNSVSVYVREDYFVIKNNADEIISGNKFMLSEAAERAIYYKFRDIFNDSYKVGFIVTDQGIPVVVTDLEAARLGETFSRIEIKR